MLLNNSDEMCEYTKAKKTSKINQQGKPKKKQGRKSGEGSSSKAQLQINEAEKTLETPALVPEPVVYSIPDSVNTGMLNTEETSEVKKSTLRADAPAFERSGMVES